jgi:hypothetical protein
VAYWCFSMLTGLEKEMAICLVKRKLIETSLGWPFDISNVTHWDLLMATSFVKLIAARHLWHLY